MQLLPNQNYKFQNILRKWFDDNDSESIKYKLVCLLLSGESNPDEKLNLTDKQEQYDNLLKSICRISEFQHEMDLRQYNYSTKQLEIWAIKSAKEKFFLR